MHPHDAKDWTPSTESAIRSLAQSAQCVAVGECGLDYNRNFSPQDVQRDVFAKQVRDQRSITERSKINSQLDIACDLSRPLFIHEREAHEDMVSLSFQLVLEFRRGYKLKKKN